jgi:lipoprotein-anchoring transpeptidase ErfK/SrfK
MSIILDSNTRKGKWIIVDLPGHRIEIYEDGRLVKAIVHFSVGRKGHLTPLVHDTQILPHKRFRVHKSSIYPRPSGGASMPYSLFFTETAAFHGGSVQQESHGCVHLQDRDAQWLFDWVAGTEVHVRFVGPYSHRHSSADPGPHWRVG